MKKQKTSKFLLAENPMLPDLLPHVYHSRKPRFMAKIVMIEFSDLPVKSGETGEIISYLNTDGLVELYQIKVIDQIDEADLTGVLARMGDWYIAYLKREDEQINGQSGHLLRDYNNNIPNLKICYSENAQRWLVIYHGSIEAFDTEPEMDEHLINYLGFAETQLEEGYINRFVTINNN